MKDVAIDDNYRVSNVPSSWTGNETVGYLKAMACQAALVWTPNVSWVPDAANEVMTVAVAEAIEMVDPTTLVNDNGLYPGSRFTEKIDEFRPLISVEATRLRSQLKGARLAEAFRRLVALQHGSAQQLQGPALSAKRNFALSAQRMLVVEFERLATRPTGRHASTPWHDGMLDPRMLREQRNLAAELERRLENFNFLYVDVSEKTSWGRPAPLPTATSTSVCPHCGSRNQNYRICGSCRRVRFRV